MDDVFGVDIQKYTVIRVFCRRSYESSLDVIARIAKQCVNKF